jgi:hypothetical protein
MKTEKRLKFKLWWEIKNPHTIEVECVRCKGTKLEECWDDFLISFTNCSLCNGSGEMEVVDPDQYPEIKQSLINDIQKLIDERTSSDSKN